MFKINIIALVLAIGISVSSYVVSPDHVAIHFGINGKPDSWASSASLLAISIGTYALAVVPIIFIGSYASKIPFSMLNIPHKEHWSKPELKEILYEKLESSMAPFGLALTIFLAFVHILLLEANLSSGGSLNMLAFYLALFIFTGYTIFWVVRLYSSFSPEASQQLTKG